MIDVCMVLEGTYPYVAGGVSTWVQQLISSMKDIKFGIVHIAAQSDPNRKIKYVVPDHVVFLKDIYLHDYDLQPQKLRSPRSADFEVIKSFFESMPEISDLHFRDFVKIFRGENACFDTHRFFHDQHIWNFVKKFYDRLCPQMSFVDFFWTWRSTFLPLLQILRAEIPQAKIYHSVSTGYAGLLAGIARCIYPQSRFLLTEHGIYTYERMLEISQANWIYEKDTESYRATSEMSFFKQWWIFFFKMLSAISYKYTDEIFTLYEGNRLRQIAEGAPPQKIRIIPNGIDIHSYLNIERQKSERPQIGLIGRVVNIKDIKTYIQAARLVLKSFPSALFYVIGPTDEEEDYVDECRAMTEAYGLGENLIFTGRVDVKEYYSKLDIVVLTSLSEAQPFIILEANLAGIPVVATDVGACREMLEGISRDDRALGMSGIITIVSSPGHTAEAICKLLNEPQTAKKMGKVGQERVRRFYDQDDLLSRYLNIYEHYLA